MPRRTPGDQRAIICLDAPIGSRGAMCPDGSLPETPARRDSAKESTMRFRVLIETDEDGVFIATCPSLPGCVSQGKRRTEALVNIRDARAAYVASLEKHGEAVPPSVDEEVVEIHP